MASLNIFYETSGYFNWKRRHFGISFINLNNSY